MTYKTLMVHLELDGNNDGVLAVAAELARRFDSHLVGIAAVQPAMTMFEQGNPLVVEEMTELKQQLEACHRQFRTATEFKGKHAEFRSQILYGSLAEYMANQARCADLVITGRDIGASLLDDSRRVNIGDLALRAGRPVLIVPPGVKQLNMRHAFLAWKDSREARRAAADGLPLLAAAGHVTVLEITSESDEDAAKARVEDVACWLERHGISATTAVVGTKSDQTGYLRAELLDRKCDLLVAGAYGHNRLGEWVFGGVTRDVLLNPDCCVLLSH